MMDVINTALGTLIGLALFYLALKPLLDWIAKGRLKLFKYQYPTIQVLLLGLLIKKQIVTVIDVRIRLPYWVAYYEFDERVWTSEGCVKTGRKFWDKDISGYPSLKVSKGVFRERDLSRHGETKEYLWQRKYPKWLGFLNKPEPQPMFKYDN